MADSNISKYLRTRHWPLADKLALYTAEPNENGCRLWMGAKTYNGYGRVLVNGRLTGAHQAAWNVANGPIPVGMNVCHTCDMRSCVAEDHLFLGTHKDNMADMRAKGRSTYGEKSVDAKLTEQQVLEIRASSERQHILATRHGVTPSNISAIQRRKSWKHLP